MVHGEVGQPAYWKFSWGGKILASWDSPFKDIRIEGTIGSRNGVVYVYTGYMNTLFAINETTLEQIWNTTNLVSSTNPYSNSPLEWNEDYSILYLSTANQIHAINAANGNIIWSTQPTAGHTYYAPLIRSTLDNTFVVKYYNNSLVKYNITNGQVVWAKQLQGINWATTPPPTVDNTDGSIYVTTFSVWIYKLDINGNVVWSQTDGNGSFNYHSPVLFSSEYVLISGTNGFMKLYNTTSGESFSVFKYEVNGTAMQMFSQPLFNREKNVLYIVYSDTSALVALDTSNMFNFTVMWSLDTLLSNYGGAGPSIASDGTIFMANTDSESAVGLVSIGCPVTKQLSSDGMSCVCAPVFVASGDSCVCSDDTKEPSEDGLSCVDKPGIPRSADPASTNTPAPAKTTSSAAAIGLNLLMIVSLVALQL